MVEALLFWALALYGAVMLTWHCIRRFQRRHQRPHPVTLILVVKNAEQQIEGIVRMLMLRTAMSTRERRILVIDYASEDETPNILEHLTTVHTCLQFVTVSNDVDFLCQLQSACLNSDCVGCIYDLRINGMLGDVTADLTALCQ